jgi:hypothetical protein
MAGLAMLVFISKFPLQSEDSMGRGMGVIGIMICILFISTALYQIYLLITLPKQQIVIAPVAIRAVS